MTAWDNLVPLPLVLQDQKYYVADTRNVFGSQQEYNHSLMLVVEPSHMLIDGTAWLKIAVNSE